MTRPDMLNHPRLTTYAEGYAETKRQFARAGTTATGRELDLMRELLRLALIAEDKTANERARRADYVAELLGRRDALTDRLAHLEDR